MRLTCFSLMRRGRFPTLCFAKGGAPRVEVEIQRHGYKPCLFTNLKLIHWLEVEASTELQHARSGWRCGAEGCDIAECSTAYGRIRVGQDRVIQHVERLEANLKGGFAPHVEVTKDAGVDVCLTRAAE